MLEFDGLAAGRPGEEISEPPGLLVEGVACGASAGALDVTFDLPMA
jgi:hypothetical protein